MGVADFAALPGITPGVSLALVLLAMAPALASVWHAPNPRMFLRAVVHCSLCRSCAPLCIATSAETYILVAEGSVSILLLPSPICSVAVIVLVQSFASWETYWSLLKAYRPSAKALGICPMGKSVGSCLQEPCVRAQLHAGLPCARKGGPPGDRAGRDAGDRRRCGRGGLPLPGDDVNICAAAPHLQPPGVAPQGAATRQQHTLLAMNISRQGGQPVILSCYADCTHD